MGTKPKTRVCVIADDENYLLFWIRQLSAGSLNLNVTHNEKFHDSQKLTHEFIDQHYSVHKSNNGSDTTITQKTQLGNGRTRSIASFIPDTSDYLLWLVFCKRVPAITPRAFNLRTKDRILHLPPYSRRKNTLYYSVFIAKGYPYDFEERQDIGVLRLPFSEFEIIVLYSYKPWLTMGGNTAIMATSQEIVDGEISEDHYQLETASQPPELIFDIHLRYVETFIEDVVEELYRLRPASQVEVLEMLYMRNWTISKMPFE